MDHDPGESARRSQEALAVSALFLPAQTPLGLNHGNVLVALRRVEFGVLTEHRLRTFVNPLIRLGLYVRETLLLAHPFIEAVSDSSETG